MRLTIAYSKIKKRNLVLINNATYKRETLSERPIRQPLSLLYNYLSKTPLYEIMLISVYEMRQIYFYTTAMLLLCLHKCLANSWLEQWECLWESDKIISCVEIHKVSEVSSKFILAKSHQLY